MRVWHSVAVVLVGVMALFGCEEKTVAPPAAPPAAEVGVITLKPEPVVLTVTLAGRTKPSLDAEIRPQISGIVLERNFDEGGMIQAGQQLYLIDPAPYLEEINKAKAALTKARANARSAQRRAERYRSLVTARAVSRQDYDDAVANFEQAQAEVETAQSAVKTAQINLDYTKVYSPITGRAGRSNVTVGALITANQAEPMVTVQQLNPMFVEVTESTGALNKLRRDWASGALVRDPGADVKLYFDDDVLYDQTGKFEFADINVDLGTGTFVIRSTFPNPDNILLPGMFVRAELVQGKMPSALLVPAGGLTRNPKGEAVVMLVKNQTVVQQVVTALQMVGQYWVVTEGVNAGDQVIIEGLQFIRPGMPVGKINELSPTAGSQG